MMHVVEIQRNIKRTKNTTLKYYTNRLKDI